MKRRNFISQSLSLTSAAAGLSILNLPFNAAHAATAGKKIFVVFLRGGFDALYAFPSAATATHSILQTRRPNVFQADQYKNFVTSPYKDVLKYHRDLNIFDTETAFAILTHAGSVNSTRSHFEQMDYIEGGDSSRILKIGYLARALNAQPGVRSLAIGDKLPAALSGGNPLLLSGPSSINDNILVFNPTRNATVARTAPHLGMPERLRYVSAKDLISDCNAKDRVCNASQLAAESYDFLKGITMSGVGPFALAGAISKSSYAPQIITIDVDGWDIHDDAIDRMSGSLGLLTKLNDGLKTLKAELGGWNNSVVVVMSEFGRTISQNGTGGVDHGRGGAMIVLGEQVRAPQNARRNWSFATGDLDGSGSSQAFKVNTDYRNVLSSVMVNHLGLSDVFGAASSIFPNHTFADPRIFG